MLPEHALRVQELHIIRKRAIVSPFNETVRELVITLNQQLAASVTVSCDLDCPV